MTAELAILKYTDDLGRILTIPLTATQIQKWFECFENHKPFIVYVSDQYRGVNPSKIIDWTIAGVSEDLKSMERTHIADITWESMKPIVKQEKELPSTSKEDTSDNLVQNEKTPPLETETVLTENKLDTPNGRVSYKKETLFKVECKCGEEYTFYNFRRSTRSGCKSCNQIVVVDYSVGLIETDRGEAWLMTNKYWVDKQPHPDDQIKETPTNDFKTDVIKNALNKWSAKNLK